MKEVTTSELQFVISELNSYKIKWLRDLKKVDLKEFYNHMEYVFLRAGYRNFKHSGGGRPIYL